MIDEQVAVLEAERHGLGVSDDELAQQIFSIPGLQENGQFIGEARYEQLLQAQNPPMTKAQRMITRFIPSPPFCHTTGRVRPPR